MIYPNLELELKARLKVAGDTRIAGDYHLNITDVRSSDEGTYMCTLRDIPGPGSGSYIQQLNVIMSKYRGIFNCISLTRTYKKGLLCKLRLFRSCNNFTKLRQQLLHERIHSF